MSIINFKKFDKTYTEYYRIVEQATVEDFVNLLKEPHNFSIFEFLYGYSNVKIYLDVEKIPKENEQLIYEIIEKLKEFVKRTAGVDLEHYVLTFNPSSRHEGLSYHLIFTDYYVQTNYKIKAMLSQFISENVGYKDYIDLSVYSDKRCFRCVGQKNIYGKTVQEFAEDDKHTIISEGGTIEDTIIQNVKNSKLFEHEYQLNRAFGESKDGSIQNVNRQRQNPVKITIVNNIPPQQPQTSEVSQPKQIDEIDEILGKLMVLTLTSSNEKVITWANNEIEEYNKSKHFNFPIGQIQTMLTNLLNQSKA